MPTSYWDNPSRFLRESQEIEFKYFRELTNKSNIMSVLRKRPEMVELRRAVEDHPNELPTKEYFVVSAGMTLTEFAMHDVRDRMT